MKPLTKLTVLAFFSALHWQVAFAQPFSLTAPGGPIPAFGETEGFGVYPVFVPVELGAIQVLEFELGMLSHERPEDLDIYLINPYGVVAKVMTDRGGAIAVTGLTLTFADDAIAPPPVAGPLASARYRTQGLSEASDGGLASQGYAMPTDFPWELIIIDDASGAQGTIGSITIRGMAQPLAQVPAVSEWGLAVLTLTGLIVGTLLFRQS